MQSEGYFTKYYTPNRVGGVEPWSAGTLKGGCIALGLRLACAGLAPGLRLKWGWIRIPPENIV